MYSLIFQPEYVLTFCTNFKESQSICAYKRYAYKKERIAIRKSQTIYFQRLL